MTYLVGLSVFVVVIMLMSLIHLICDLIGSFWKKKH